MVGNHETKTRWRIKGEADDAWIEDRAAAERALAARCFEKAFEEIRRHRGVRHRCPKNLSPR